MPNPLGKSFIRGLRSPSAPSGYPSNWSKITGTVKEKSRYKCDLCSVDCSKHTELTDTHHKNRDKSDCRDDNLQCLCKLCHAKQPRHEHYRVEEAHKKEILRLREEQGI